MAWIAIGVAAFFILRTEQQIASGRAAARAFDRQARETTDAIAELRAAQEAYVAAGQGLAFWVPKVGATADAASHGVAGLAASARSGEARAALDEAASTLADFTAADRRARDYLKSGQPLMAADVIFTEGAGDGVAASQKVETARLAEHQALDTREAAARRVQALAAGGAGALAALAVLLLVPGPRRRAAAEAPPTTATPSSADRREEQAGLGRITPVPAPAARPDPPASSSRGAATVLRAAAQVCTEFGRIATLADLQALLGRAADMMDATGMVVWIGSAAGGDLRPALAHGYATQALARMPVVPRSADNAAAAAYRTGALQIVLARPGQQTGAVVAPIIASAGCIGALSVEVRGGGESSDAVQALAAIFAAQIAGVVAAEPPAERAAAAN